MLCARKGARGHQTTRLHYTPRAYNSTNAATDYTTTTTQHNMSTTPHKTPVVQTWHTHSTWRTRVCPTGGIPDTITCSALGVASLGLETQVGQTTSHPHRLKSGLGAASNLQPHCPRSPSVRHHTLTKTNITQRGARHSHYWERRKEKGSKQVDQPAEKRKSKRMRNIALTRMHTYRLREQPGRGHQCGVVDVQKHEERLAPA